eukprot:CAMPEP_0115558020 /NCGR_PEP_ID=MMETSP0271-20121206/99223_1 /TAXON_ID=71861 /ORGANISM="Scrippsiella trochoidea, Strain CCMP3099" /LENGTH=49 /DNA_ID= /DNA_START= /DNA_END= /DNA_ORIENTATION=
MSTAAMQRLDRNNSHEEEAAAEEVLHASSGTASGIICDVRMLRHALAPV